MTNKKATENLQLWNKSIANHVWWAAETCEKDADLLEEKYFSLLNHIVDVHEWDDGSKLSSCSHENLSEKERNDKLWLEKESESYQILKKLITDPKLVRDIRQLRHFVHTSALESFHNVILKYAPKRLFFPLKICGCE